MRVLGERVLSSTVQHWTRPVEAVVRQVLVGGDFQAGASVMLPMKSTPETEAQRLNESFLEITPTRDEETERQRTAAALVCN